MPKVEYTEVARKELINIIGYTVDAWGQLQALKYVDGLEILAQRLAETPALGKHRVDLSSKRKILSFPYEKHILYYAATNQSTPAIRALEADEPEFWTEPLCVQQFQVRA